MAYFVVQNLVKLYFTATSYGKIYTKFIRHEVRSSFKRMNLFIIEPKFSRNILYLRGFWRWVGENPSFKTLWVWLSYGYGVYIHLSPRRTNDVPQNSSIQGLSALTVHRFRLRIFGDKVRWRHVVWCEDFWWESLMRYFVWDLRVLYGKESFKMILFAKTLDKRRVFW